ncbi:McrB family protein [Winogradskyella sp. PC D3.3]
MINYKDYEKQVYDWLMQKHKNDPNFTFSLRMKGSKGAELDYFIGTEKSKYFGMTFWTLPVNFPGSSGDCIDLIFAFSNNIYSYNFEFTQTKSPHNPQNQSALDLIDSLKDSSISSLGFSYSSPDSNKMLTLKTNQRQEGYTSIVALLEDVDKDLKIVLPAVNKAIAGEKKNNPDFKAHRITLSEFNTMQTRLAKRLKKYKNVNLTEDKAIQINELVLENKSYNIETGNYYAPLNQIFYGPPGTGKTYHTILEAAKIVTQNTDLNYSEAQTVFNENLGDRIEFITFHQNYSYEDFIQGLRPDIEQKALSFNRADGIFTKMVTNALFEYYKVYQKNQKISASEENSKIDLNDVFIEFVNSLKEGQEFKTKTGGTVKVDNFTDRQNIEFRAINGVKSYLVSGNRLLKLYETFNDINKIKRVNQDIVDVIGGCNATMYYVALREFIEFLKIYKDTATEFEDVNDTITYENITYRRKKELLFNVNNKDLHTISEYNVPKYVIIIDEINRANISRVFGELITLIEKDKRSHGKIPLSATLPSGEKFIVPSNLYIIGTMNTADKSIALLDIALRRRFEFVPMYPDSNSTEHKIVNDPIILDAINNEIISRKGHDFTIGHSYFMGDDYNLIKTIDNKVIPLLLEYFMNDFEEVKKILGAANIKVDGWPLQYVAND